MKNNFKLKSGSAHPPLSGESLAGRGFWVLEKSFFGGKKGRHSNKNVMLNFTKRTAAAKRGRVSLYAELFQHLMFVRPGDKEIPKPVRNDNKVFAFTLAEVLITLVIVGVVAALTIPNLMTKYQQHVFENQFKKSLYTISQIVANTKSALGVSKLGSYCTEHTAEKGYYNQPECVTEINKHIRKTQKQTYDSATFYTINRNNELLKTYNNNNTVFASNSGTTYALFRTNQLPDGSFLGFVINNYVIYFGVDLNGKKKPNRLGYDVFLFSLNNKNDTINGFQNIIPNNNIKDEDAQHLWTGAPCNLTSTRALNGIGCTYYALRNKCPYDDTKTYWECLK